MSPGGSIAPRINDSHSSAKEGYEWFRIWLNFDKRECETSVACVSPTRVSDVCCPTNITVLTFGATGSSK